MRGRRPTPDALKILRGNPGKRSLRNRRLPKALEELKPPSSLGRHGKSLWRELAPELTRLGLLTSLDHPSFVLLCGCWDLYRESGEILTREGLSTTDERGLRRKNPLVSVHASALRDFQKIAVEFGLSPSYRSRLNIPADEEPDPVWDQFL